MREELEEGICPNCEGKGRSAEPCGERVCRKRGYCFIPVSLAPSSDALGRDPNVGRTVGESLLVDLIGEGGFGRIYLALQKPLMVKVALKMLRLETADPRLVQTLLEKFEGEAKALGQLGHPNIVRLVKYGLHEGEPYMAMELVEDARTLAQRMVGADGRPRRLAVDLQRKVVEQLLSGLEAAHRQKIIHRDIKPENIMLQAVAGNDALVRILDFGLAKFVSARTATSMAMGTPIYMAPEQLSMRHLGPWTDLYAVGVVAFEMMMGAVPFPGQSHTEILAHKLDPDFDPFEALESGAASAQARGFLKRAMAAEIEDRFQSVPEMREALGGLFEGAGGGAMAPASAAEKSATVGLLEGEGSQEDVTRRRRMEARRRAARLEDAPTQLVEPAPASPARVSVDEAEGEGEGAPLAERDVAGTVMDLGEAPTAVVVDPGVGGGRPTDSASTGPPEVVPLGEMNPDRPRSSAGLAVVVVATLLAALAALWVATTEFGAPQRTEKIMSGDGPLSASKQAEPAERAVEKQVVSLPEKKSEQGALNPRPRFSTFLGFRPGSTFAAAKRILGTADMWAKDGEPDVGESIIASFFSGEVDFKNAPYGHLHLKVSLGAKPFLERRGFVDERLDYLGASEEAILGAMAPPFEEQDGDRYYRIKAASKKIEVIHNGIDGFRVRATLHIGYNGRCKMIELVWTTG